ncbi:hypothetical protein BX600DRAFT_510227 [Xylariales sp. PMI_506]|nr:hypothetical protein BX600DRAFT_510227 [Xylariales sp. PMI_506]
MNSDSSDGRLQAFCANSHLYPTTLLRVSRPHEAHSQEAHLDYLRENDERIFSRTSQDWLIETWETYPEKSLKIKLHRNKDDLKKHLENHSEEWSVRQAFLRSKDSRSPVNCNAAMLKLLLTFQQVEPFFLDSLYTFGEQDNGLDMCLMNFYSRDNLEIIQSKPTAGPQLKTFETEIHVSYLLRTMEYESSNCKWYLRQALVYHSYNVHSARSFWLTVKGNDDFKERLKKATSTLNSLQSSATQPNVGLGSFEAALCTHLVYIAWCDERWRAYINEMEENIDDILTDAQMAPVERHLVEGAGLSDHVKQHLSRKSTIVSHATVSNANPTISQQNTQRQSTWSRINRASEILSANTRRCGLFNKKQPKQDIEMGDLNAPNKKPIISQIDVLKALENFRFANLQKLHYYGTNIRKAILTIQLNISILEDMCNYYLRLAEPTYLAQLALSNNDDQFRASILRFVNETKAISRRLEIRKVQLESLTAELEKGCALYDSILQYRNIQVSQILSESALESGDQMKLVAEKTAHQTTSMHFITVVTLIFLPGTFIATFFQSGVFLWKDAPDDMTSTWKYQGDGFWFFCACNFPIMAMIFLCWLFVYVKKRNPGMMKEYLGKGSPRE